MTIPRLLAITKYQATNPPLHIMVKWYMSDGSESQQDSISDFIAAI